MTLGCSGASSFIEIKSGGAGRQAPRADDCTRLHRLHRLTKKFGPGATWSWSNAYFLMPIVKASGLLEIFCVTLLSNSRTGSRIDARNGARPFWMRRRAGVTTLLTAILSTPKKMRLW